ncbi:ABC transporter permease [Synechococcus sp. Nb3U1]|uniref:ABC transporter permease n=1 Tax=Synechococcus sp. Nb3U1 TaxID=1914529 RepID=UPI001F459780|nr:ABC transporter permease [Synechococcus sp. Nb3U1]MCF2971775.1 ABC transporter permease [Synechococcus sp. Nb3U1]
MPEEQLNRGAVGVAEMPASGPPPEEGSSTPAVRPNLWRKLYSYRNALLIILGILLAWEVGSRWLQVPTYIMPKPSEIGVALMQHRALLWRNLWVTALEAILGFLAGNGVAILLAILFVHSRTLEQSLFPLALTIRSIPVVALAPLFLLWFGNGLLPKVIIAALICFFPTLVNMTRGLNSVDRSSLELMYTLAASPWQVFTKLRWPAALPYLLSALKISSAAAVIGALVAEWIGSDRGLGYLVVMSTFEFRIELLWATIAVTSAFAMLLFQMVNLLERVMIPWHDSFNPME